MDKKARIIFLFLLLIMFGCTKNPCDDLNNGVYIYPVEEAKGKSLEESIELYKIPKKILRCMSTSELIQSCINYPEMRMIWTHSHLQGGFDKVEAMCNGFEELWRRDDKCQELIHLYKHLGFNRDWTSYTDLENGMYLDNIIRYELILAQHEVLLDLTEVQKLELFQFILNNQKLKLEQKDSFATPGMETSVAILSRIMYNDLYQPFHKEYNKNELMQISTNYIKILNHEDIIEKVITLSEDYLKLLKNKNK